MQENQVESCQKCLQEKFRNDTKKASCADLIKKKPDAVC